jgi:hypothetical protein
MSMARAHSWISFVAVAVASTLIAPRAARGQASPADAAAAQLLFDEGMKLLAQQRYAEACPKLQESERLDPSVGTRFNLADCYEHAGKTASAWTLFLDVAAATHTAGQSDRERVARDRAAALERSLSKLQISVATPDLPGLTIERDGHAVGRPLWGQAAPIDPGDHLVRAAAPGKKPWEVHVNIGAGAAIGTINVPALEDGPADAEAVPGANTWSSARWAGVAIAGAGVAGIGAGSVLGLIAKSKNDEAHTQLNCLNANQCYSSGVALVSSAKGLGTGATIAFIAGGAALAGGAVLFVANPGANRATTGSLRNLRLDTWAGPGNAGATLRGRFE